MRQVSLFQFALQRGQGQLLACRQKPVDWESLVSSYIILSPRPHMMLVGWCLVVRNSNASDPIASFSGCHVRSKTVWDYPFRRQLSFFSCQQVLLNRFTLSGKREVHRCQREVCFGLVVLMAHLHILQAASSFIQSSEMAEATLVKSVSFWGRRNQTSPNYYRKRKRLCQLFFQEDGKLGGHSLKLSQETYFEQEKRLHIVLEIKPSVTLFLQI